MNNSNHFGQLSSACYRFEKSFQSCINSCSVHKLHALVNRSEGREEDQNKETCAEIQET